MDVVLKKLISFAQYAVEDVKNKATIITLLKVFQNIIESGEDEEKQEEL
jgi:hypothetical protein